MDIWIFDPKDQAGPLTEIPALKGARPLPDAWLDLVSRQEAPGVDATLAGLLLLVTGPEEPDSPEPSCHDPKWIMRFIRQYQVPLEVLVVSRGTPGNERDEDLEALGALATVPWGEARERLKAWVKVARGDFENKDARGTPAPNPTIATKRAFLYKSEAMRKVHREIHRYVRFGHEIVIVGETGAGKEQVALEINRLRSGPRPFLEFNCALLKGDRERQKALLFGVGRGVFPGVDPRPGLFERAGNGDLFLDEVECLGLGVQATLLKVLDDREVFALGEEHKAIHIHCGIILGFKERPDDLVRAKPRRRMRDDLNYRLKVAYIEIPALRDRPQDIPLLAYHFLLTSRDGPVKDGLRLVHEIDAKTRKRLAAYQWPGNVRTLKNVIDFALLRGSTRGSPELDGEAVDEFLERLGPEIPGIAVVPRITPSTRINLRKLVAQLKVSWINKVFRAVNSVQDTFTVLCYKDRQRFLAERQRLKADHPEIEAGLVKELRAKSSPERM